MRVSLNKHGQKLGPKGKQTRQAIIEATNKVLLQAGPRGHILNVGHGVVQVRSNNGSHVSIMDLMIKASIHPPRHPPPA